MRSVRFVVGALICATSVTLAACQKQKQWIEITAPSAFACSDGDDNDRDGKIDWPQDPGCFGPTDNTEEDGPGGSPTGPVVSARPGDFNLSGVCVGTRARLTWTRSDRADGYFVERRLWTSGAWVRLSRFYSSSETTAEVDADSRAPNYWRVVAVNASGVDTFSRSPDERDDKTATFACGRTSPPPPAPPTTGPGPGPSPGPGDTPTSPPSGGSCAGATATLPDLTTRGQTAGFSIAVPAGCGWTATSSDHHVVSVSPGSGTSSGSVTMAATTSLPGASGQATITVTAGGVVIATRTYTIS